MPITKAQLTAATSARAKAMFAAKDVSGADAGIATTEKFTLPNEDLNLITEMLNEDNPLSHYSNVNIAGTGAGTATVKYDIYNDNWKPKVDLGSSQGSDIKNIIISDEVFKWNQPHIKEEGLSAFDVKRGVPNILGPRMSVSGVKYLQDSIKKGFQVFVDKADTDGSIGTIGTLDTSSRDKMTEFQLKLIQEVTTFVTDNEIDPGDVSITVEATLFDALAINGMLGDRVTQTYAGGQYSVATLGGYTIYSGSMFLPTTVTGKATAGKIHAFVGTSKVGIHQVDYVAANTGPINNSNDIQTYLEMADIAGALDYKTHFGKVQAKIITDVTPSA